MTRQAREHRARTRRHSSNPGSAIAYYALVGLVAATLAAWFVISTLESLLGGYCDPGADFLCHYIPDLIVPSITLVTGVSLLATARRISREPPRLGPMVGVGTVVGVVVAVLPILLVVVAADGYRRASGTSSDDFNIFGSSFPTAALLLLSAIPLLWALHSAVIVWRHGARRRDEGPGE